MSNPSWKPGDGNKQPPSPFPPTDPLQPRGAISVPTSQEDTWVNEWPESDIWQVKLTELPVLRLHRDMLFPGQMLSVEIDRTDVQSVHAVKQGHSVGRVLVLETAREEDREIALVGTLARIVVRNPDVRPRIDEVVVHGKTRVSVTRMYEHGQGIAADVAHLDNPAADPGQVTALESSITCTLREAAALDVRIPGVDIGHACALQKPHELVDYLAPRAVSDIGTRRALLDAVDPVLRLRTLDSELSEWWAMAEPSRGHRQRPSSRSDGTGRSAAPAAKPSSGEQWRARLDEMGLPAKILARARSELDTLDTGTADSFERHRVHTYLNWLAKLPWKKRTRVCRDMARAQQILDAHHYGLQEVKERILEFLAVQANVRSPTGRILCLVGAPGVGKTSLGKSIAKATGRKFVRMTLGGLHDELEIRGSNRVYRGASPGGIVRRMALAGTINPLFLLDEIDKMGQSTRAEAQGAMLEVLDPSQNGEFFDQFLDIEYDLSKVLFVCTANSDNIPPALLDRMEILRLPGYTEEGKLEIARRHLVPRCLREAGLKKDDVLFGDDVVTDIVRHRTREAGVRGLFREIERIVRKVVKVRLSGGSKDAVTVLVDDLDRLCGPRKYLPVAEACHAPRVGTCFGLGWSEAGGSVLEVEAATIPGSGQHIATGSLGDVMGESVTTAVSFARGRLAALGVADDFNESHDVHVHVPDGASPKEGPSAGAAICLAVCSAISSRPIASDAAMTGEVSLRGRVLRVGGLREKLLAARRAGLARVLVPKDNLAEVQSFPAEVLGNLKIVPIANMDEVFDAMLIDTENSENAPEAMLA